MKHDVKTKLESSCNQSGAYQDLSHDLQTVEGQFEVGQFFSRLIQNAQIIESCFSNSPEFVGRLKLEEIENAQTHLRSSLLFKKINVQEWKGYLEHERLLKTAKEQILHPQIQTLPISNHEVYEIHRDLFRESLKRDAKDPKTYETRAVGIGLGLFISSVCPLAAVALFVGGSGYWIYDALRRRIEDARLVEQGQKTRDISLVFKGGQLWADGASSDVFDSGVAVTMVGMAKFLPKIVPARYLEPLPESLLPKSSPIEVIDLTKSSPIEVIDLSKSPIGNPTSTPETPIVMKASSSGNPSIGNAEGLSTGTVNSEFIVSAKPTAPVSEIVSVESVGYDIAPSGAQQGGVAANPSAQGRLKASWFPFWLLPTPLQAPGVSKDEAQMPGYEKERDFKVDVPGAGNKEQIGDKKENPAPVKDPAHSDMNPLQVVEDGNGYGPSEAETVFKLTDRNTQKIFAFVWVNGRLPGAMIPDEKQFSRFVFQTTQIKGDSVLFSGQKLKMIGGKRLHDEFLMVQDGPERSFTLPLLQAFRMGIVDGQGHLNRDPFSQHFIKNEPTQIERVRMHEEKIGIHHLESDTGERFRLTQDIRQPGDLFPVRWNLPAVSQIRLAGPSIVVRAAIDSRVADSFFPKGRPEPITVKLPKVEAERLGLLRGGNPVSVENGNVIFYLEKMEAALNPTRLVLDKVRHSSHTSYFIESDGNTYYLIQPELKTPPTNDHLSIKIRSVTQKGNVALFEGSYYSKDSTDPFRPPAPFTLELPRKEAIALGLIDSNGILKRRSPLYFVKGQAPMQTLTPFSQGVGGAGTGPLNLPGSPLGKKGAFFAPHDNPQGAQAMYPVTSIGNRSFDASLISSENGLSHDRPESKWRNWEVSTAHEDKVYLLSPKHLGGNRYKMFFKGPNSTPFWVGQRVDIVWQGPAGSGETQRKLFQECQMDLVSLETGLELEQIGSVCITDSGLLLGRALEARADMYRKQDGVQSPLPPTRIDLDLPSVLGLSEFNIRKKPTVRDLVSFALEYTRMKSALPVAQIYEDLKQQKEAEATKVIPTAHLDGLKEKLRNLKVELIGSAPFNLREEWNLFVLEIAARSPNPQEAWREHQATLDQKIEVLEGRLGYPLGAHYDDYVLHQLNNGRHRIMPQGEDRLLVSEETLREELRNLIQERMSLPEEPRKAWEIALEERIALLERVTNNYSNDPEVNGQEDLDAVVWAQHELLNQKEDPSYQIHIETRAKVATVVQWARKVEAFKKSGNPADRPFELLALFEAKVAADQKRKLKENPSPSTEIHKQ